MNLMIEFDLIWLAPFAPLPLSNMYCIVAVFYCTLSEYSLTQTLTMRGQLTNLLTS